MTITPRKIQDAVTRAASNSGSAETARLLQFADTRFWQGIADDINTTDRDNSSAFDQGRQRATKPASNGWNIQ